MLLGSINYGANLAYAMTFLLAGLVLVILHHCHNNLLGIKLRFAGAEPVFAGELASFRIAVSNNSNTAKNEIEIALPKSSNLPLNLAPDEAKTTKIKLRCESRGWQSLSRFSVSTYYPASLFRAWTWVHMEALCLVYPAPAKPGVPLPQSPSGHQRRGMLQHDDADFHGFHKATPSDSPQRIAWKAYARNDELLVKEFKGAEGEPCLLDWDLIPAGSTETRLSQLTRWCLDAHAQSRDFGLRIPGTSLPIGGGERHLHECLRALAVFEMPIQ